MSDQNVDATAEFTITRIFDAPRDMSGRRGPTPTRRRAGGIRRVSAVLVSMSRSIPELAERTAT